MCAPCASGSFSTGTNSEACSRWRNCEAGTFVSTVPSATADRECTDCDPETHSSNENSASCAPLGTCAAGTYETEAATSTSDVVCEACPEGHYCAGGTSEPEACEAGTWDGENSASPCVAHSVCSAGHYALNTPSAAVDRACAPCDADTYSDQENAESCAAWVDCEPGEFVTQTPSPIQNRECTPCATGFTTTQNESACTAWTICDESEFESVAPTATNDRECAVNVLVPGNTTLVAERHGVQATCSEWNGSTCTQPKLRPVALVCEDYAYADEWHAIHFDGNFYCFYATGDRTVLSFSNSATWAGPPTVHGHWSGSSCAETATTEPHGFAAGELSNGASLAWDYARGAIGTLAIECDW